MNTKVDTKDTKVDRKYTDVMIDLETCSTEYNACIVCIGCIRFNCYDLTLPLIEKEIFVDIEDAKILGAHESKETMDWWNRQSPEIRQHMFETTPRKSLKDALLELNELCKGNIRYWSCGSFDQLVLEQSFKMVKQKPLWKYYEWNDIRTIRNMYPFQLKKSDQAHDACSDCKQQIDVLRFVFQGYGLIQEQIDFTDRVELSKSEDWICNQCMFSNYKSKQECYKCRVKK